MTLLDQLQGGLVVSCQPVDGGPLDDPKIIAATCAAAIAGGAVGVRVEGVENVRAARGDIAAPIIGIVKHDAQDTEVRITPRVSDVHALRAAGADIIAFDATARPREDSRETVLQAIHNSGALAMADCAREEDGHWAHACGVSILGTTLSGYTKETLRDDENPDLDLVRQFRNLGSFVMAEGRYNTPDLAALALASGANSVTVGTALTRLEVMTSTFVSAMTQGGTDATQ